MISLTNGLAGQGGSYMNLIYAPYYLAPTWSGYIYGKPVFTGGHSHAYQEAYENIPKTHSKKFKFETIIAGKEFNKNYKVNYPLPIVKVINISIRGIDKK